MKGQVDRIRVRRLGDLVELILGQHIAAKRYITEGQRVPATARKLPDLLKMRYGGTNNAKRVLRNIGEMRNGFLDIQKHLFR